MTNSKLTIHITLNNVGCFKLHCPITYFCLMRGRETSWQERLCYQYPQRFIQFDQTQRRYLLKTRSPTTSNLDQFTVKVFTGNTVILKLCKKSFLN